MNFELPWNQCGVIADLTKRLKDVSPQFGKTALQKMVFLLQEIYKVDVGYSFGFHTYGPFAGELLGDLNFAERMGAVQVKSVEGSYGNGYLIEPGDKIGDIVARAEPFLTKHGKELDALVAAFGSKTAKDLELLTTIIYLNKEIMWDENKMTRTEAIGKIRELKPKFTDTDVRRGMAELTDKHHVSLVFAA